MVKLILSIFAGCGFLAALIWGIYDSIKHPDKHEITEEELEDFWWTAP